MSVLVVSGTGTGVGKTVVTAALAALAATRGARVAVVKPAQTGAAADDQGDLDGVRRLAGVTDLHEHARFPDPLSPASARIEPPSRRRSMPSTASTSPTRFTLDRKRTRSPRTSSAAAALATGVTGALTCAAGAPAGRRPRRPGD